MDVIDGIVFGQPMEFDIVVDQIKLVLQSIIYSKVLILQESDGQLSFYNTVKTIMVSPKSIKYILVSGT